MNIDLYDANGGYVVLTGLLLMTTVFLLMIGIFLMIYKKKPGFYKRRREFFKDETSSFPPCSTTTGMRWVYKCFLWSSSDIYESFGLDTLVLLKSTKMLLMMSSIIAIPSLCILLPVHVYASPWIDTHDVLTVTTIVSIQPGSRLIWIHCVTMYFATAAVCLFLYLSWKDVVKYRQLNFQKHPTLFATFLIRDIPLFPDPKIAERELQQKLSEMMLPSQDFLIYLLRSPLTLEPLMKKHDKLCRRMRPAVHDCNVSVSSEECNEPLVATEHCLSVSPQHGSLDLSHIELVRNYDDLQEAVSASQDQFLPSAVVVVSDIRLAQAFLSTCFSTNQDEYIVNICPDSLSVRWKNLKVSPWKRRVTRAAMNFLTSVIIFFWALPFAAVAGITKAIALSAQFKKFKDVNKFLYIFTKYVLVTFIPLAFIQLFLFVLPMIFQVMVRREGYTSRTQEEFDVLTKLSAFNVIDTFFVFMLSGSIFQKLRDFITSPIEVAVLLAQTIPIQFNFYLLYIGLNIFILNPWDMIQGTDLLLRLLHKISPCCCRPEDSSKPIDPGYMYKFSRMFIMFGIGISFSLISPLIVPAWVLFFLSSYLCIAFAEEESNLSLYNYNGEFWPVVSDWVIAHTVIMQLVMIGVFSLKGATWMIMLAFACPVATVFLSYVIKRRFNKTFYFPTIQVSKEVGKISKDRMMKRQREYYIESMVPPINMTRKEHKWKAVLRRYSPSLADTA